jgi:hypothetical protein
LTATTETTLIGAGAAARLIGVSTEYLRQLAAAGRIEYQMTPYGRLYDLGDAERFRRERAERRNGA